MAVKGVTASGVTANDVTGSTRELARECLQSPIAYRGAQVENVAQLAAAAVALSKTKAI